jgi:hydroxyquinol 1,2-dioxygenase
MIRATTGESWRPAHLHFRIAAPGLRPLVTHLFNRQSERLNRDAVFGVRPSLVADFVRYSGGTAPDGRIMSRAFCTLEHDFVMAAA